MALYPIARHWVEVSDVTSFAAVFGPEWREQPVPARLDVRWRAVFGYSSLASRVINYVGILARTQHLPTLGALAAALLTQYTVNQRFGRGIGAMGTAYLLTALGVTPPVASPTAPPSPQALRQAAARQLRVVAISIQEAVTPESLAALQQIHQTLSALCSPVAGVVAEYPR